MALRCHLDECWDLCLVPNYGNVGADLRKGIYSAELPCDPQERESHLGQKRSIWNWPMDDCFAPNNGLFVLVERMAAMGRVPRLRSSVSRSADLGAGTVHECRKLCSAKIGKAQIACLVRSFHLPSTPAVQVTPVLPGTIGLDRVRMILKTSRERA